MEYLEFMFRDLFHFLGSLFIIVIIGAVITDAIESILRSITKIISARDKYKK